MINPKGTPDERLAQAQDMFDEAKLYWQPMHSEMINAQVFHHNTDNEGQWNSDDLKRLRENKRAALTFNVTANKIYQVTGLNEEHQMRPVAQPVGVEDRSLSEFLTGILESLGRQYDFDLFDNEIFENALIEGEHALHVDVTHDPRNPGWLKYKFCVVPGTDIAWDIASTMRDRSDARLVFWWRWVTKDEFKVEYPDLASQVDALFDEDGNTLPYAEESMYESGFATSTNVDRDDYSQYAGMVNRKTRELRIIHCEYKTPIKKHYAMLQDGRFTPVEPDMAAALKKRRTQQPGMVKQVVEVWDEEWYVMEFTKGMELFHGPSYQPYDGCSLVPMMCYRDRTTGYAYGLIRHMRDPQMDINKAHSQSLDHLGAQAKPGWLAERSVVPDQQQFEDSNARSASVTVVEDGALSGGRIIERKVPTYSEAAATRLEVARNLHDLVSGIQMDPESPARTQEAATTVNLREKRSLRSLRQVIENHRRYQKQVSQRVVQSILRAMPVDQMMDLLGNPERWTVDQNTGELVDNNRKISLDLKDIRSLYANIELEASEGDLQRSSQLAVCAQLQQLGVQIDPEYIYKLMAPSRAVFEQLVEFAKNAAQSQMQASQQQQQTAQQQLQSQNALDAAKIKTDRMKLYETVRHNASQEKNDVVLRLLEILEKADTNEKGFLLNLKKSLDQQFDNEQGAINGGPAGE